MQSKSKVLTNFCLIIDLSLLCFGKCNYKSWIWPDLRRVIQIQVVKERIQSPRSIMKMCPLTVAPKKKSNSISECLFFLLAILQRTASIKEVLGSLQHGISLKYQQGWMLFASKGGQLGIDLKWKSMREFPIHKLYLPDSLFITLRGCFTFPLFPNINFHSRTGEPSQEGRRHSWKYVYHPPAFEAEKDRIPGPDMRRGPK